MTARRLNHNSKKTPAMTGGPDEQPTCPAPLDLIDDVYARGRRGNIARDRLFVHCSRCELRDTCWADKKFRDALRDTGDDAA